jgi:hypothetical protein
MKEFDVLQIISLIKNHKENKEVINIDKDDEEMAAIKEMKD